MTAGLTQTEALLSLSQVKNDHKNNPSSSKLHLHKEPKSGVAGHLIQCALTCLQNVCVCEGGGVYGSARRETRGLLRAGG